ncbi:MAG: signal recognition particle-docking protein FtsY [Desulfomonilaceae bacterium]|nr:signal recognition particle-docking protein FtsY [Desulfomonilaceae bacterium]
MSEEKPKKGGLFRRLFGKDKPEETPVESTGAESSLSEAVPEHETREAVAEAPIDAELKDEESEEIAEKKRGFFKLRSGLTKTRKGFIRSLDEALLGQRRLDDTTVERLEEVLITADIGVQTAYQLLDSVTDRLKRREFDKPEKVIGHIKGLVKEMLSEVESPLTVGYGFQPFVVMVVGVNGSGKTTTIAKIAARHQDAGRKVLMVAGDTFRAAAVEQLEIWADRVGCPIVKGKEKADPSSVAFEAMERALEEDVELVLVDTAGRLHTRVPLMEELKKVHRTLGKKISGAPHETLLVIDASMGQNAILQARTFNEAVPITGVALTKLDGTSKGGVILGISNELKIPIRFVGVGEKMDDLRDFNAGDFAEALFASDDTTDD